MKKIIVFASGSGTNAESIIRHFSAQQIAQVVAVFTNNSQAGVIAKAQHLQVPVEVFTKPEFEAGTVLEAVGKYQPDLLVLAGFLWKITAPFLTAYPNKIINIHPALLPKYGGKGMYGMLVHQAVLDQKETETGISIHLVNEHYDEGALLFQQSVSIVDCKTAEEVAHKVHDLEYAHYAQVIESYLIAPHN